MQLVHRTGRLLYDSVMSERAEVRGKVSISIVSQLKIGQYYHLHKVSYHAVPLRLKIIVMLFYDAATSDRAEGRDTRKTKVGISMVHRSIRKFDSTAP